MRINVLLGIAALSTIIATACGDTEDPPPDRVTDAGGLDAAKLDATTPDGTTTTDANVVDVAVPDVVVVDSAVDSAVDAGSDAPACPPASDMVTGSIKVTADDYLRLWVNGVLIDDKVTTWNTVDTRTVSLFRHPQMKNVIAVEARNAFNQGGLDRGLLAHLSFETDAGVPPLGDGGLPSIVTDTSWKMAGENADGGLPDSGVPDGSAADAGIVGWFDPTFDDSTWRVPVDEVGHGGGPWGAVFGTSHARWLWAYDSATAVSKPASEYVYFRKSFYFDNDGSLRDTAGVCQ